MSILVVVGLVSAFLAFFFLFRTFYCVRRRRMFRAGGACISCLFSAALAAISIAFAFSYLSYTRLIEEQIVSRLDFRQVGAEQFEARLMIDGKVDQLFVLHGNEWQLDARILTWKPPATILGLDPVYQLDRLSGRYRDIERERSAARSVHALATESPADVWNVARRYPMMLPGVEAFYGTATFLPMADGARFNVYLSRDALLARPANQSAEAAVGAWQ